MIIWPLNKTVLENTASEERDLEKATGKIKCTQDDIKKLAELDAVWMS